jgi:hypothetical protein
LWSTRLNEKFQDGEIASGSTSVRTLSSVILAAPGQPLRIAKATGRVLPGGVDCGSLP